MHNQVDHVAFCVLKTKGSASTPNIPQSSMCEKSVETVANGCLWHVTLRSSDHRKALLGLCHLSSEVGSFRWNTPLKSDVRSRRFLLPLNCLPHILSTTKYCV